MIFWPRGRTLVIGWRRDLRSLTVASGDTESGIELPPNLTVSFIVDPAIVGASTLQLQFSSLVILISFRFS